VRVTDFGDYVLEFLENNVDGFHREVVPQTGESGYNACGSLCRLDKRQLPELASFGLELYCNGKLSQTGGGALVLDSPLRALHHLVNLLAKDPHNPPLGAGELVSTGTLTLAMPLNAGETWTTRVWGIPLEDITLQLEA
jgi:2-keto-4-pentenoate hydratase